MYQEQDVGKNGLKKYFHKWEIVDVNVSLV